MALYGALIGDMVGAPYEFKGYKSKEFPLFSRKTIYTDDSMMTVAVAEALLDARDWKVEDEENVVKEFLVQSMKKWGSQGAICGVWRKVFRVAGIGLCQPLQKLQERLGHAGLFSWLALS